MVVTVAPACLYVSSRRAPPGWCRGFRRVRWFAPDGIQYLWCKRRLVVRCDSVRSDRSRWSDQRRAGRASFSSLMRSSVTGRLDRKSATSTNIYSVNMTNAPPDASESTSQSLLRRAQQQDGNAWRRLTELYAPLVYGWARRAGLQENDAADVGQEVFRTVALKIADYRQDGGSGFRAWLWGITRNKLREFSRTRAAEPQNEVGHGYCPLLMSATNLIRQVGILRSSKSALSLTTKAVCCGACHAPSSTTMGTAAIARTKRGTSVSQFQVSDGSHSRCQLSVINVESGIPDRRLPNSIPKGVHLGVQQAKGYGSPK